MNIIEFNHYEILPFVSVNIWCYFRTTLLPEQLRYMGTDLDGELQKQT